MIGRPRVWASMAVASLLPLGCSGGDDADLMAPTIASTGPISVELSPKEEAAVAAAEDAVATYLKVYSDVLVDPDHDLAELEAVAIIPALSAARARAEEARAEGSHAVGERMAGDATVVSVDAEPEAEAESVPHPWVDLQVCVQFSDDYDFVDSDGQSMRQGETDEYLTRFVVVDAGYPNEDNWVVSNEEAILTEDAEPEVMPCD